jgi:hypothetical protein
MSNLSEVDVLNNGSAQAAEATFSTAPTSINFESHAESGDATKPDVVQGQLLPASGQSTLPSQIQLVLSTSDDGSGRPALSVTLPTSTSFCVGGATDCNPQSPGDYPNAITMWVDASDVVTVNGLICLDNGNTVAYDNCPSTHAKEIRLNDIEMEHARLELNRPKILVPTNNNQYEADPGTKLYLDTDGVGIKIGEFDYIVPTEEPTIIKADLIRTHDDTTKPYVPFYGLAVDSLGNAGNIHQDGSLDCQNLHIYQEQTAGPVPLFDEVTDNVIPDDWGQDLIHDVGCSGE